MNEPLKINLNRWRPYRDYLCHAREYTRLRDAYRVDSDAIGRAMTLAEEFLFRIFWVGI